MVNPIALTKRKYNNENHQTAFCFEQNTFPTFFRRIKTPSVKEKPTKIIKLATLTTPYFA